jgi:hypothetical protein
VVINWIFDPGISFNFIDLLLFLGGQIPLLVPIGMNSR